MDVVSLMEGAWSCYRSGHFNEGRMVINPQFNEGRMVVTEVGSNGERMILWKRPV